MPITVEADGSEDVNDFLLRIRELGDQRDKEDEERTRKLEEEIIKGRKERQARRAERARSLSPNKETSSNAGTPSSVRSRNDMSMQEEFSRTPSLHKPPPSRGESEDDAPPKLNGNHPTKYIRDDIGGLRDLPQPPSKPQNLSNTSPSAAIPSRSGTLSWQQRPSSRGSTGSRSRPLSMLTSDQRVSRSLTSEAGLESDSDETKSRSQIARSLGSKDPTWFRQTEDRGQGSAAYRRNQEEEKSDTSSKRGSMRLAGISRESTSEPEGRTSPTPESVRSSSPSTVSREGSARGMPGLGHQYTSFASSSAGGFRSPIPTMSSQRFEPPSSDTSSSQTGEVPSLSRTMMMSLSQERISPERMERPTSPTKGLGGFVQSAMLKRSDSVNKRWSAHAGPGLSRGNSVASNQSGYTSSRYPMGGITPLRESRPNSMSREASPSLDARPISSHSNATVKRSKDEVERPGTATSLASNKSESLPRNNPTNSSQPKEEKTPPPEKQTKIEPLMSPPMSPSKKWSPKKASWLENAIKKPESPQVLPPAPQQPAWMAEINRNKQQRGSVDLGKGSNFKEVATGGLIRSPPPGSVYKLPGIGGIPSGFSAGVAKKPRTGSSDDVQAVTSSVAARTDDKTPIPSPPKAPDSEVIPPHETALTSTREATKSSLPVDDNKSPAVSQTSSTTLSKKKPETHPKKDVRIAPRPTQTSGETRNKDEPEFKNVFGKLKRTQTQNYVAPNELKDNIMRGKAGLAQTGGPMKTERKDELRESILKKKKNMIAPSASTRITSNSMKDQDAPAPEAIARRKGLSRSDSILSNGAPEVEKEVSEPEALTKLQHLRDKPKSTAPEIQPPSPAFAQNETSPSSNLGGNFASSLAGILQKGPSLVAGTKVTTTQSAKTQVFSTPFSPPSSEQDASGGPQLTHATKGRARGPKRKLPTATKQGAAALTISQPEPQRQYSENIPFTVTTKPKSSALSPGRAEPRPLSNITDSNNNNRKASQPAPPRKPSSTISAPQDLKTSSAAVQSSNKEIPPKSPSVAVQKQAAPNLGNIQKTPVARQEPRRTPETQPSIQESKRESPFMDMKDPRRPEETDGLLPSVKGAAALWGQSSRSPQPGSPKSPVKLPTRKDEEAAMEEAGLKTKDEAISSPRNMPSQPVNAPKSPDSPKSPPLPGKKPASIVTRVSSLLSSPAMIKPNISSPTKPSHVAQLFADLFDEPPSSKTKININTQAILKSRSTSNSTQKIKTLRKQIHEIADHGKAVPVPSHQEHILFEESLYLCIHVFGNPAGTRTTEVYLWSGDGVSSPSAEDAQLFARKVAKDNNAKLIILQQGKESPNFFQALGGIVITKRGPSSRPESMYMLCGRQHMGQIAFDEVDFSPRSLCKGFPYIISAHGGKLYLWKGSGAGADELGCARLIGMDLGLTGEIEEIDEGKEPDEFWTAFAAGKPSITNEEGASGHPWHLKPSYEQYATRLFNIDVQEQRPKSSSSFMQWGRRGSAPSTNTNAPATAYISEVAPFAQADLVHDAVFVLDAFFEIFVILPLRSLAPAPQHRSTHSLPFRAALLFAQDYGILAASAEDRPFVPVSSVVIVANDGNTGEHIPEGLKRGFRKWTFDGGCRVISLGEALEAAGA